MPVDAADFKQVLRRWASGVTVVTAKAGDRVHGMTVSAFSSVSVDPPLVLVCANRSSTTHAFIEAGGIFTVNILSSDQAEVSDVFASAEQEDSRFDVVRWSETDGGAPTIDGALAALECSVVSAHTEGSHTIYIGQVESVQVRDAAPLLYYGGSYRGLADTD